MAVVLDHMAKRVTDHMAKKGTDQAPVEAEQLQMESLQLVASPWLALPQKVTLEPVAVHSVGHAGHACSPQLRLHRLLVEQTAPTAVKLIWPFQKRCASHCQCHPNPLERSIRAIIQKTKTREKNASC